MLPALITTNPNFFPFISNMFFALSPDAIKTVPHPGEFPMVASGFSNFTLGDRKTIAEDFLADF
jgi:hypothetical protein